MKLFIGFGYNQEDEWIRELVFPLAKAFDFTIATGEDLHGEIISNEVAERIRTSDAFLAFLTRRDELQNGKFTTHRWVTDELTTALNHRIAALEVRERMIDPQGGQQGDRQRLEFALENKAELLTELANVLATWRKKLTTKRLVLLPEEIVRQARPFIDTPQLTCTYRYMSGSKRSGEFTSTPFRLGQGLCVDVVNAPAEDALIQIKLKSPTFSWSSAYESIQLLSVNLQKD